MPPVAGRIAWARQLYEVIDKPMQALSGQKQILNTPEGRKIVKNFNRMAAVLVEFEVRKSVNFITSMDYMYPNNIITRTLAILLHVH